MFPVPTSQRAREIFEESLEIDEPHALAEYLRRECGEDQALRRRVEQLVKSNDSAPLILPDAPPNASDSNHSAGRVGETLGRYTLVDKLGEGGVGVVFLAEQQQPIRRQVALKILRPEMGTRTVIARFEAERQVLALMDHPNIAKILDAGSTEDGRPYFVMEWVRGCKITEYCRQKDLSTKEQIRLLILVCEAVQHAHMKGIIHRDLKPSNILVCEPISAGIAPAPKIIDFGIAKSTDIPLENNTTPLSRQLIGTPAYMSPEQADMAGAEIDTRTDIYSLGVILYELLTGKTPFDTQSLLDSGVEEMRRLIRETEPKCPSMQLRPNCSEAKFGRTLPSSILARDLDSICLKCLAKKPS